MGKELVNEFSAVGKDLPISITSFHLVSWS